MESPGPGRPSRETGLPPGVEVGPLGRRFVAYLIECLVPAIVAGVLVVMLPGASATVRGVLAIVGALVIVAWAIIVIYMQAEKAAGPGMRLMKLQLVGFYDGRPIGWGRVLIRALILWLLIATVIGAVILLITMLTHPRRQGWHDRAAKAVVIKERVLAPPPDRQSVAQSQVSGPPQDGSRAHVRAGHPLFPGADRPVCIRAGAGPAHPSDGNGLSADRLPRRRLPAGGRPVSAAGVPPARAGPLPTGPTEPGTQGRPDPTRRCPDPDRGRPARGAARPPPRSRRRLRPAGASRPRRRFRPGRCPLRPPPSLLDRSTTGWRSSTTGAG